MSGDVTLNKIQRKSLFVGQLWFAGHFVLKTFSFEGILSEVLAVNQEK